MTYRIRNKKRLATDSIRGYVYQLLHTIRLWLELDEGKVLVAEGNEDIDELVVSGNAVVSAREIQIKQRSTAIGTGSKPVREMILHSFEAFAEYEAKRVAYQGVFLTNATLRSKDTQIAKWATGKTLNHEKLTLELKALANRSGAKYVAAFRTVESHPAKFISAITWTDQAGHESDVIDALATLVTARVPQVNAQLGINALMVRMCQAMSQSDLAQRSVTRLDADLVLNDAMLATYAGLEAPRTGWTAAVWSQVANTPYSAVAVALFVLDRERYLKRCAELEAEARLKKRVITRDALLEEFVHGDFSFVAYASLRRKQGPRGVRVCLRDVVRQAQHRHVPDQLLVQKGAPKWLEDWLQKRWGMPIQVTAGSSEQLWIDLAKVIGGIVARDPATALETLGTKLRWVHEVESEKYFTMDRPRG